MNLTPAQFFGMNSRRNGPHIGRALCALLCILLLTAAPVLAEPITSNQVVQTLTTSQGIADLRINTLVSQDPVSSGTKVGTQQGGPRSESAAGPQGGAKGESLLSDATVSSDPQKLGVEVIEEGEVEGTICDCGELLVAAAGFPKWSFLFLAAVPLAFINECEDCNETPISTPTPTPPDNDSSPTPEPASLLLFGTGLLAAGAGLRRRYTKAKLAQTKAEEE
ncbi:MAG TPA: PEP-CTERM sorting domain-containing protein [Pyrinomonadaceae bacterium]|nr:PEP-CTERM sorting domain-containing protein [Pyrinomonadaceae bacterium]